MILDAHFDHQSHQVKIVEDKEGGYLVTVDNQEPFHIDVIDKLAGGYSLLYKGRSYEFDIESKEDHYFILSRGNVYTIDLIDQKSGGLRGKESDEKKIIARMPGKIIKVLAKEGSEITKGQGVIIMEAMKMENELKAPTSGKVKMVKVKEGQTVEGGAELLLIE